MQQPVFDTHSYFKASPLIQCPDQHESGGTRTRLHACVSCSAQEGKEGKTAIFPRLSAHDELLPILDRVSGISAAGAALFLCAQSHMTKKPYSFSGGFVWNESSNLIDSIGDGPDRPTTCARAIHPVKYDEASIMMQSQMRLPLRERSATGRRN